MTKPQINALTGIRGFAAIWVLLHHLVNQFPIDGNSYHWIEILAQKGWLGVDLFFILSGFVISYVHQKDFTNRLTSIDYRRFLILRFARVYPVHIITTLSLIPIYLVASYLFAYESPVDAFSLEKLFYSITLTNGLGITNSAGWNLPSWSVSAECFAYLLFPLASFHLFSRPMSIVTNLIACLGLLVGTLVLGYWLSDGSQYMLPWSGTLARIATEFALGCLLYNIYKQLPTHFANRMASGALTFLILLILLQLPNRWDFLFLIGFLFLILGLTNNQSFVSSIMSHRLSIYLGQISYSIYLSHSVVFIVLGAAFKKWIPDGGYQHAGLAAIIYIVSVIAISHLLFNLVETKARDSIKQHFLKGKTHRRQEVQMAIYNDN